MTNKITPATPNQHLERMYELLQEVELYHYVAFIRPIIRHSGHLSDNDIVVEISGESFPFPLHIQSRDRDVGYSQTHAIFSLVQIMNLILRPRGLRIHLNLARDKSGNNLHQLKNILLGDVGVDRYSHDYYEWWMISGEVAAI